MIERIFRCDGPDCERHVRTPRDSPPTFIVVSEWESSDLHFCGWDCVLRFGAKIEPEEVIHAD